MMSKKSFLVFFTTIIVISCMAQNEDISAYNYLNKLNGVSFYYDWDRANPFDKSAGYKLVVLAVNNTSVRKVATFQIKFITENEKRENVERIIEPYEQRWMTLQQVPKNLEKQKFEYWFTVENKSQGTTYGNEVSYNSSNNITKPSLTTYSVTNITSTTASCGGKITNAGNSTITERGVCWSKTSNPTISNSKTSNGTGTGSFSSSISGLSANTMYYVRAYATNSAGTAYGNQVSFKTESQVGSVVFWSKRNLSGSFVYQWYINDVHLNNVTGGHLQRSKEPNCDDYYTVTLSNFPVGKHTYKFTGASASHVIWSGEFYITANQCIRIELF